MLFESCWRRTWSSGWTHLWNSAPNNYILSSFTHPCVIPNLCDLLSSVEHEDILRNICVYRMTVSGPLVPHRRKKFIQVWNNMKVSKQFIFGVDYPYKVKKKEYWDILKFMWFFFKLKLFEQWTRCVSSNVAQSKWSKIYTESDRSARSVLVRFKGEWRAYKCFWEETTGLAFGSHLCCCVNAVFQPFLYECTQNVGWGSGSMCSIVCQSHWACGYWLPLIVTGFMYLRHYQSLSVLVIQSKSETSKNNTP